MTFHHSFIRSYRGSFSRIVEVRFGRYCLTLHFTRNVSK